MTDEATDLLIRARSFIERGWCQNAVALDDNHRPCGVTDERAVAWCAHGALVASGVEPGAKTHPAMIRLCAAMGDSIIGNFNDRQETVEPILAAFDRAIAAGG